MQEKKFMRYKRLLVEEVKYLQHMRESDTRQAKGIKDMKFFDVVVITASDEEQVLSSRIDPGNPRACDR